MTLQLYSAYKTATKALQSVMHRANKIKYKAHHIHHVHEFLWEISASIQELKICICSYLQAPQIYTYNHGTLETALTKWMKMPQCNFNTSSEAQ